MNHPIKTETSPRNSNIEYLRIFSMLIIIAYHATRVIYNLSYPTGYSYLYVYGCGTIISSWGILGVDLFLIISAWFLVDQKFRIQKILSILFQTVSWMFLLSILSILYDFWNTKSISAALYSYLDWFVTAGITHPFWTKSYWFVTAYICMLLASPLLNRILNKASKAELQKGLLLFLFIPLLSPFGSGAVNDIVYFCYVYVLIGYLKRYAQTSLHKAAKPIYILLLSAVIVIARLVMCFDTTELPFDIFHNVLSVTFSHTERHSLVLLVDSILIFFWVASLKPRFHKIANGIASCTFGVYLFHGNFFASLPNTQNVFFQKLIDYGFIRASVLFPVQYLIATLLLFFLGTGLEYLRLIFIHKPVMKAVEKKFSAKFQRIDNWFNT